MVRVGVRVGVGVGVGVRVRVRVGVRVGVRANVRARVGLTCDEAAPALEEEAEAACSRAARETPT